MLKTVAQIKDELIALADKVTAIHELAKVENRDLTDAEQAEIDGINGLGDNKGKIEALKLDLERAQNLENKQKEIAALRGSKLIKNQTPTGDQRPAIKIPAKARLHGSLKAFKGPKAEVHAYRAGMWLAASFTGNQKARKFCSEQGIRIKNAMSESDNSSGGLFVPSEMSLAIIRLVESYGLARQKCDIEPMASNTKTVPVRVSGMTAYPVGETTTANEGSNSGTKSQPIWTNIELVARKWKAWTKFSDELDEDSAIMIADKVAEECALAFAYSEDNCLFNGDGTSTYHGIQGILAKLAAGAVYTAAAANLAFSTLDLEDFEGLVGAFPDIPGCEPEWYISKEGYAASMLRLTMAAGGNTADNLERGGRKVFMGFPVNFSNCLNKTLTNQASTKLCLFGDLRMGVKFGDRRKMTMKLTDQRYWDEDQVAIKAEERFDINVHSIGSATEAGVIMALATPAS